MKEPNFFIIGSVKAGTTSLSGYLRDHRQIFIPSERRLQYFTRDLKEGDQSAFTARFLEGFEEANESHVAVGGGTSMYLASERAVPQILEFNPAAKFIAILRSPVDVAYAWHSQLCYNFAEDEENFEAAWNLQAERAEGRRIPKGNGWPWCLQYREMFLFGEQVERLYSRVPRERVLICFTEDLAADAGAVYRDILSFLGVEDDGRSEFPVMNRNRVYRNDTIGKFARHRSAGRRKLTRRIKGALGLQDFEVLKFLRNANRKVVRREGMEPGTRRMLVDAYRSDVEKLAGLTGRDLDHWL